MGRGRLWKQVDVDYLTDNWGDIPIPCIAKKLNRSIEGIVLKAHKIGLKRSYHSGTDYITVFQLAKALGRKGAYTEYYQKLQKAGCPIKKKLMINKKVRIIKLKEFWKWAEKHKNLVNFSKIEEWALGEEPAWVAERRKIDFYEKPKMPRVWTADDKKYLIFLLKQYKYTYDEIAVKLNRTERAVIRMIAELDLKIWPVRREARFWTLEEITKARAMVDKGYSYETIGKELGRSGCSIRGKIEQQYGCQPA